MGSPLAVRPFKAFLFCIFPFAKKGERNRGSKSVCIFFLKNVFVDTKGENGGFVIVHFFILRALQEEGRLED